MGAIMLINNISRPSVGADLSCATADLSAFRAFSHYPDYCVTIHYRPSRRLASSKKEGSDHI